MPAVETSLMYIGTIIVNMPTAKPAIARPRCGVQHGLQSCFSECFIPVKAIGMFTAPAWSAEPTVKMTTAIMIDPFRPKRSATGPLTREPNQAASSNVETNQPLKELSV